jgi:hypothetical protein
VVRGSVEAIARRRVPDKHGSGASRPAWARFPRSQTASQGHRGRTSTCPGVPRVAADGAAATEPGTTTTLPGASVEVTVLDAAANPVANADVTITYVGGDGAFDSADDAGVVVFPGQPIGVAATVVRHGSGRPDGHDDVSGIRRGLNRVTVSVW